MKRKVLCLFSFFLILLVFCTFVSPKAEDEMRTLVDARQTFVASSGRNISVAGIAITWANSDDVLYNLIEGDGWESGLRIAEIPSTYYSRYEGHVELGPGTDYRYIYSASRDPVSGGAVTPVEESWKGDDTYLLWHPDTLGSLDKLPNSMEPLRQNENAALVSMRRATFPYFEHRVWYTLREKLGEDVRIYSLHDVRQFLNALPWISGVVAVLLCSLLLWGASCLLFDKMGRRKGLMWLNILLIAGLLAALPWLLGQFDLPASLMPAESILDIPHYIQAFERILSALESLGDFETLSLLEQTMTQSVKVLGFGLLAAAVVVLIEGLWCRYRRRKELF